MLSIAEDDDVSIQEDNEPLDLSMKGKEERYSEKQRPTLSRYELQHVLNVSNVKTMDLALPDSKGQFVTEQEVEKLITPYVKRIHKKFSCTVCDIKFACKVKALTHVENKHVDCLLYKCPLCRASKGTRLAYESHLRRGHGAKVKDYCSSIRIKKSFYVKSEVKSRHIEIQEGQPYDLEFVTYLRHILSLGDEFNHPVTYAEWVDQHQGTFRINSREQFAKGWYRYKVSVDVESKYTFYCFLLQGLDSGSWDCLYTSVIAEFVNKNIFKELDSDELVFQVFCIKQLLK